MGKHHDFLEEGEEQNQPLIKLLRTVYQPGQQDVHSVARIRERLLTGNYQSTHTQQKTFPNRQTSNNTYNQQKHYGGIGTMNSYVSAPKTSRSRLCRPGVAAIAALFVLALFIGSLFIALNLIHHPSQVTKPTPGIVPPTSAATSTVMPGVTKTPTLVPALPHTPTRVMNIHMVDSATGWIFCADGSVLRTTDGGLTWTDATPPALVALKQAHEGAGYLFLDGSTAWIVVTVEINNTSADNLQPLVFHTSDAGQTWQEGTLPKNEAMITANPLYNIAVVSDQEAWVLDTHIEGASGGSNGGAQSGVNGLFHTTDGGKTWTQAQNAPTLGNYNYAPGISFANQQTGIITGSSTASQTRTGVISLTQDGGASWRSISLSSPAPNQWQIEGLLSSQFLTPNDGIVIASFRSTATEGVTGVPSGEGFSVFSTHDGGQTWASSPVVNIGVVGGAAAARFFNAQQGYVLANVGQVGQLQVYSTSDGGQHWNSTALSQLNQNTGASNSAGLLEFTSPTAGWVLLASQPGAPLHPTSLYTTVDGGQTWTQVRAHFPSFITPKSAY